MAETEDERAFQLKEIVDMTVAAGYFRGRIEGLSPFDKVAGAMVWAISMSGVGVGTNILYEENASAGQRIKTGEAIVRALISMKCPYQVDPHQIHNWIDYPVLSRVIQWLIRRVLEYRQEVGDSIRAYSVAKFEQSYDKFPEEKQTENAAAFVGQVARRYKPTRKFRKQADLLFPSKTEHVDATLLEYGEKFYQDDSLAGEAGEGESSAAGGGSSSSLLQAGSSSKMSSKIAAAVGAADKHAIANGFVGSKKKMTKEEAAAEAEAAAARKAEETQKRLDNIKEGLVEEDEPERVSKLNVMEDIAAEEQLHEERRADQDQSFEARVEESKEIVFQRKIEGMKKRMQKLKEEYETVKTKRDNLKKRIAASTAKHKKLVEYNKKVETETAKLRGLQEKDSNNEVLGQLDRLVKLNENLKAQEAAFKKNCKEQLSSFKAKIKDIDDDVPTAEKDRMEKIQSLFDAENVKFQKYRQILARTNQEVSRLERKIDDVPTRAELLQYERRFVELYELVAEKLKETKKYYAMYNTLDESHGYMAKEVSLLKSIQEGFPNAVKHPDSLKQFLESFQKIVDGVSQNSAKVQKDLEAENASLDKVSVEHQKLVDRQRKYYKAVKDFTDECIKNDMLREKGEALQRKAKAKR